MIFIYKLLLKIQISIHKLLCLAQYKRKIVLYFILVMR
jgi:hypothetical protein